MEWIPATAVMNEVACQKAKVCQEWENWYTTKDNSEEGKIN
jgi:hypothetical protein